MQRTILWLGAISALLLGLAGPAWAAKSKAPITTTFEIAGSPRLNAEIPPGAITLHWRGTPDFTPPEGAMLKFSVLAPGGDRYAISIVEERTLSLAAGQAVAQSFQFQPTGPGQWIVIATIVMPNGAIQYSAADQVAIDVAPGGKATLGRERAVSAAKLSGMPSLILRNGALAPEKNAGRPKALQDTLIQAWHPSLEDSAPKLQIATHGAFTVKGYVRYTDRTYTTGPFTGTTTRPVRRARVYIYEDEGGNPLQLIGTAYTNNNGYFSFVVPDNVDGPGEGGRDIRFAVYAISADGSSVTDAGEFIHGTELGIKYNWGGGTMDVGTLTIGLASSAAFNIFDTIMKGHDYVMAKGEPLKQCDTRWFVGHTEGSHYTNAETMIYLDGSAATGDEWADHVILHEYGHFACHTYGYDKSPGGDHGWFGVANAPLAWSEGWASFFGAIVLNSKYYIDQDAASWYHINLETVKNNSGDALGKLGDANEGMVAAALFDIWDSKNDGVDTLSAGSANIWTIFTNDFTSGKKCVMLDFYNGWKSRGFADRGKVDQILGQFGITYSGNREVWFPSGTGYVVIRGQQLQMQWARFGSATVTAKLMRNNLTVKTIGDYQDTSGDVGQQTVYWTISNDVVAGDNYKLRVVDKENPTLFATSDSTFRIINPPIVISVGAASVTRSISVPGEEDWYRFTAQANTTYIIETLPIGGGLADSYMTLNGPDYPSFFAKVTYDDDSGIGAMAKITKYLTSPGTYYIMVEAYDGVSTGQYGIRVRKQ